MIDGGNGDGHVPETKLLEDAVQERLHGPKTMTIGRSHYAAQPKGNDKHKYRTAGTKGKLR